MKRARKVSESEPEIEEEQSEMESDPENNDGNESDAHNESSNEPDDAESQPPPAKKKKKRGILYLSTIPKHMTVAIAREMLGQYAQLGRMYFEPETKKNAADAPSKKKSKKFQVRHFAEGWVEFESKRAAKAVCQRLNGQPIAMRKSSKFADILWSMKYLPRFKWVHLSERLTYEKAVHKQKMQAEVSQARKEAAFFQENLDRSDKNKRLKKLKAKANKA